MVLFGQYLHNEACSQAVLLDVPSILKAQNNMIKKAIAIFFSAALTGCMTVIPGTQSTYSDTKNTTPRVYSSNLESSLAAKCVIKNIDELLPHMIASITPEAPRPNVLEVRARSEAGFAAIMEISPVDGRGSLITTWISNHYIHANGSITKKITKDC